MAYCRTACNGLLAAVGVGEPGVERQVPTTVDGLESGPDAAQAHGLGAVDQACLESQQPLEHGVLVVLVGEVDAVVAAGDDVAQDLEHPGRLPEALGTAERATSSPDRTPPLR